MLAATFANVERPVGLCIQAERTQLSPHLPGLIYIRQFCGVKEKQGNGRNEMQHHKFLLLKGSNKNQVMHLITMFSFQ
jgi:hypothetical protein